MFSWHCCRLDRPFALCVGAQEQHSVVVEQATIKAALSPEHVALNVDLPPDEVPFTELHEVRLPDLQPLWLNSVAGSQNAQNARKGPRRKAFPLCCITTQHYSVAQSFVTVAI